MKAIQSLFICFVLAGLGTSLEAGTRTWDGRHDTANIQVTIAYFVPADREPLVDWRQRADYYAHRIEKFHAREFGEQSRLQTIVHPAPIISKSTTSALRKGDANRIFFRTLSEVDRQLKFAEERENAFPILLVLREINWRPLDDFYRLRPAKEGLEFEGNYNRGQHFPGARSGGARATYLADRGIGWGLVSADGWRVPYRGSDCVVYHEGVGHTVGLPHPEPGNGSVMSLGQYRGWLSESWLDKDQKSRLGWSPETAKQADPNDLYSTFRAIPEPMVPTPNQSVQLKLNWPQEAKVKNLRLRYQTSLDSTWIDAETPPLDTVPPALELGTFERSTPVSYRIDVELKDGQSTELWGYLQVRDDPSQPAMPVQRSRDLITVVESQSIRDHSIDEEINLLPGTDLDKLWSVGSWEMKDNRLESPKQFGARLELPFHPPEEYQITLVVEPLDAPNGLIVGHVLDGQRFLSLCNYRRGNEALSALENIDGRNVGNETTYIGDIFKQNRISQIVITVMMGRVRVRADGHLICDWEGSPKQLSLGDYWSTPDAKSLFLGSYDCRYRFHRVSLLPLKGRGEKIGKP